MSAATTSGAVLTRHATVCKEISAGQRMQYELGERIVVLHSPQAKPTNENGEQEVYHFDLFASNRYRDD